MDTKVIGISNTANAFFKAFKRCMEQRDLPNGKFEMLAVPGIVCLAFSAELYIKSIITAQGSNVKGHKLNDLFNEIKQPLKNQIITETGIDENGFNQRLTAVSNSFVEWRYIYEQSSMSADIQFMLNFVKKLQNSSNHLINHSKS